MATNILNLAHSYIDTHYNNALEDLDDLKAVEKAAAGLFKSICRGPYLWSQTLREENAMWVICYSLVYAMVCSEYLADALAEMRYPHCIDVEMPKELIDAHKAMQVDH